MAQQSVHVLFGFFGAHFVWHFLLDSNVCMLSSRARVKFFFFLSQTLGYILSPSYEQSRVTRSPKDDLRMFFVFCFRASSYWHATFYTGYVRLLSHGFDPGCDASQEQDTKQEVVEC